MATDERKNYQKALMDFIGCRPVAYWPRLAHLVGGVKAAIMLSQILYWEGDAIAKERGWVLKSVEEFDTETGLTELEQKTARRILMNDGLIKAKLCGVPRIWHYQVDRDRLGEILIARQHRPMATPSNGNTVQRCEGSPSNVRRRNRGMFPRATVQLKEESETTVKNTTIESTSSSSSSKASTNVPPVHEEEEAPALSSELLEELQAIGVYANLIPEIARSGFTEDQIFLMIDQAEEAEPEPGKTAALLMYKIRNTPRAAKSIQTPDERDAENRRRYITGEYADVIQH